MVKIPPIKPEKMTKILEKFGFKKVRQKGSHVILINEERTRIVVPVHKGKDLNPSLVRVILKQAEIKREKFLELIKKT